MHFRFPFSLFSKGLGYAITKLSFYGSQYVNNADTMVNEINITKNAHFSLPKIIKTADKPRPRITLYYVCKRQAYNGAISQTDIIRFDSFFAKNNSPGVKPTKL